MIVEFLLVGSVVFTVGVLSFALGLWAIGAVEKWKGESK